MITASWYGDVIAGKVQGKNGQVKKVFGELMRVEGVVKDAKRSVNGRKDIKLT